MNRYILITIFSFLFINSFCLKAESLVPEILDPRPGEECVFKAISDNGNWAAYSNYIVDISTYPFIYHNIQGDVRDVADNGKVAVGSNNGSPAVWKEGKGWQRLPVPSGTQGGSAKCITPDGRYAVGVVGLGIVNSSDGCMWDLETLSIIPLPNKPTEDRSTHTNDPNHYQNQYDGISADGRYILGNLSYSYVGYQNAYVYDRKTDEVKYIGYKKEGSKFIPDDPMIHYTECESISHDGRYVTGPVYITKGLEYISAYRYDVLNDKFEYYDEDNQADAWGFCVTDDGLVFLRKSAYNPYSEGYVCYNNFFYSFHDILTIGYGIDLREYNIDNTGVPVRCSADGRTFQFINSPQTCYIVKFKEDLKDVCERLELLKSYNVSPRQETVMSAVSYINFDFEYPITLNSGKISDVKLCDSDGNTVGVPVKNGGVYTSGNSLKVIFMTVALEPHKEYFLKIPAGLCSVAKLPSKVNSEIVVKYIGREEGPVRRMSVIPKNNTEISHLDLQETPILVSFSSSVKLNSEVKDPIYVYIDDVSEPIQTLYCGQYNDNTVAIFPSLKFPLYQGSNYTIKVPEGLVTDISGYGPSEPFEINYIGNYVPQLGDEKYLFRSSCDNWDNFLFYEGDYGTPVSEYENMGFTADTTPWWVVRDNANSVDMAFGSHSCYVDGRASDDWVVTRQIMIPDESAYLAFDGQSYKMNKRDVLKIYVYSTESIINSLTKNIVDEIKQNGDLIFDEALDPGATEEGLENEWTHYAISLQEYAGKKIYIAFVNQNQNQSLVMVDNIEVVKDKSAFISLMTPTTVVANDETSIKGFLIIDNELANYNNISLTLYDSQNNNISSITEKGVTLKGGDNYQFEFPDKLKLVPGEETAFSIKYQLDDFEDSYSGSIKNLAFEPVKKIILEEFTGRDCPNCPQGLIMVDFLSSMFPNNFIPIGLYCYNGSDPKGITVMGYNNFLNMPGAPCARINRGPSIFPMYSSMETGKFYYSGTQLPASENATLWYDEVVNQLGQPTYLGVDVIPTSYKPNDYLSFSVQVKSALHCKNQNLRVFGVLLENGLTDYQRNGFYETEDPLLGDWGKGGSKGSSIVPTVFDHVAKATWGLSYNGTGNLLPASLNALDEYNVDITFDTPSYITDINNCEFVVMIIDGDTGEVINAARTEKISGIASLNGEGENIEIVIEGNMVKVNSLQECLLEIYSPSGMLISRVKGKGDLESDLSGYSGFVIINARTQAESKTQKYWIR